MEVSESDTGGITVPQREFGGTEPKAGDECVLMGNTENPLRQNLISISATEDGQPRVDILDGVMAKTSTAVCAAGWVILTVSRTALSRRIANHTGTVSMATTYI